MLAATHFELSAVLMKEILLNGAQKTKRKFKDGSSACPFWPDDELFPLSIGCLT